MARIYLKNVGKYAVVDDEEYGHLKKFTWYRGQNGYVVRRGRTREDKKAWYLHRWIMGEPGGRLVVDHINHDALDNRKSNLRICYQHNNGANQKKCKTLKSSRYKGVFMDKSGKNWTAKISPNRKQIWLGTFKTEHEAALAYNTAACKYFGEFALLNDI